MTRQKNQKISGTLIIVMESLKCFQVTDTWLLKHMVSYTKPVLQNFVIYFEKLKNSTDRVIERVDQNGWNSYLLYHNVYVRIHQIALDYYNRDVYWIETVGDFGQKRIRYVNFHGGQVKFFEITNGPSNDFHTENLAVDKNYVYYVAKLADGNDRLLRAWKNNGTFDVDFDVSEIDDDQPEIERGEFKSVFVTDGNWVVEERAKNHPCAGNNGNCLGFCVAVPDKNKNPVKKCIEPDTILEKINRWFFNHFVVVI